MEQFESICLIRIHSANTFEREWIIFVEFLAVDIQTPTNRETRKKKRTKKTPEGTTPQGKPTYAINRSGAL